VRTSFDARGRSPNVRSNGRPLLGRGAGGRSPGFLFPAAAVGRRPVRPQRRSVIRNNCRPPEQAQNQSLQSAVRFHLIAVVCGWTPKAFISNGLYKRETPTERESGWGPDNRALPSGKTKALQQHTLIRLIDKEWLRLIFCASRYQKKASHQPINRAPAPETSPERRKRPQPIRNRRPATCAGEIRLAVALLRRTTSHPSLRRGRRGARW
jgi:hypothetical protein